MFYRLGVVCVSSGEKIVEDIKWATRKLYSSEEAIKIALDGLRGGSGGIPELCRPLHVSCM